MKSNFADTRKLGWLILFIGVLFYSGTIVSTIIGLDPNFSLLMAHFRLFGVALACWGAWYSYYDQAKLHDPKLNFRLMIFLSLVVLVALIASLKLAGLILEDL